MSALIPWPVMLLCIYLRSLARATFSYITTRRPVPPAPPYLPSSLFDVNLASAYIHSSSSPFLLSAVLIHTRLCHRFPNTAQNHKRHRYVSRYLSPRSGLLRCLLFFLTVGSLTPVAYALPGTNQVLIHGDKSLDSHCQARHIDDAISAYRDATRPSSFVPSPSVASGSPSSDSCEPQVFIADTDSHAFAVDTGANRVIVNDPKLLRDFRPTRGAVQGVNGRSTPICGTGTYDLVLASDAGARTTVRITNTVYVPTSPYCLAPPQLIIRHMRQQGLHVYDSCHNDQRYVFNYRTRPHGPHHSLTVPLNAQGLFLFRTSPGYSKLFRAAPSIDSMFSCFAGAAHVIPDDDNPPFLSSSSSREVETSSPKPSKSPVTHQVPYDEQDFAPNKSSPEPADFPSSFTELLDADSPPSDPATAMYRRKQQRLATIHERMGHISYARLKLLARAGLIPRELADVDPLVCPGCAYGKAHRKPWRSKGKSNLKHLRAATAPGQVVSVDKLVSPTPGFVPTHRGAPTTQRYEGATVFVDHYSDFTYVHLMTHLDAESTVQAKQAFERESAQYGVRVEHYHADNGLFDSKLFKEAVENASQRLSFCGVNAHHQNGKAESRIKDITMGARTALLHAAHRWPEAIHPSLWPAALKHYVNLRNSLPTKFEAEQQQGRQKTLAKYYESPLAKFSGTQVEPNFRSQTCLWLAGVCSS